jgi:uncharacterized protein (DUF1778 family)
MDNNRNRTVRLVTLVNPKDAQRIKNAAYAARMTVSTWLLIAAISKATKQED